MKIIRNFFVFLYRAWFYILITLPIVVLFPLLLLSVARRSWYPMFFRLAQFWARFILFGMGFLPKIKRLQNTVKGKSYMYIANHTSMADIMLTLHTVHNPFVFVGKQELARFPLFGFFYKRTCILVDRGDPKSRLAVFKQAQQRLAQGLSICIFPEGGVPDKNDVLLDTFKDGAFRLAIDHQIPVVPMVFFDNKKRFSYKFDSVSPGKMRVKVLPFIETRDFKEAARRELRDIAFTKIEHELINQQLTDQKRF